METINHTIMERGGDRVYKNDNTDKNAKKRKRSNFTVVHEIRTVGLTLSQIEDMVVTAR